MDVQFPDIAAVIVLPLDNIPTPREIVFRWRVRLRVLMGDADLLNDPRVKVVGVLSKRRKAAWRSMP